MRRKYFFWGLFVIAAAVPSLAETPPMVERHIFSPESTTEQKPDAAPAAVDGSDLLKDIQFTGVMNTEKGKLAIIVESAKNEKNKKKQIIKEGGLIKGMTLKEIGPNYVLIQNKENTVKLNLYKGIKTRPMPPAEPALPEQPAAPHESMNPPIPGGPGTVQQQMSFQGAGKSDLMPNKGPVANPPLPMPVTDGGAVIPGVPNWGGMPSPQAPASGINPFPGVMKKAPEQNSPAGNTGGPAVNPFITPAN